MVNPPAKLFTFSHLLHLFGFLGLLFILGCGPVSNVTIAPDFKPLPEKEIIYILPFSTTLVPHDISETVFNDLVDNLNDNNKQTDIRWFSIIKEDPTQIPSEWLAKQVYLSGEIWSYIENSGCCATEMRIKAKLLLHEPGKSKATLEVIIPLETFFEHDNNTVDNERLKFAKKLAEELSNEVLKAMSQRR